MNIDYSSWFLQPGRLWLLLVVAGLVALYVWRQRRAPQYAVRFANLAMLDKVAPKRPGWRRHLAAGLLLGSLAVLVVAFAQPKATERVEAERATVILAIDVSLSMMATDIAPDRITAAREKAVQFVEGLPDRVNLGLISFAGTASLLVPPTQDHERVSRAIERLELAESTAIGSAVQLGVKTIESQDTDTDDKVPGVIVLLSDGETTVGLPTAEAIPIAREAEVPVWTIGFGTPGGILTIEDAAGMEQRVPVPVNLPELRQLAEGTGGQAFEAESADELEQAYADLGSAIGYEEQETDVTYRFVGAGMLLLLAAVALSLRWFSRIP